MKFPEFQNQNIRKFILPAVIVLGVAILGVAFLLFSHAGAPLDSDANQTSREVTSQVNAAMTEEFVADELLVQYKPGTAEKNIKDSLSENKITLKGPVFRGPELTADNLSGWQVVKLELPMNVQAEIQAPDRLPVLKLNPNLSQDQAQSSLDQLKSRFAQTGTNSTETQSLLQQISPASTTAAKQAAATIGNKSDRQLIAFLNAKIRQLNKDSAIQTVQFNRVYRTDATPNDPYFSSNSSVPQGDLYGLKQINMPKAWDISVGSPNVVVADVDTGVDRNHPDIAANMWVNTREIRDNGVDDDGNGYVDDYYGWNFANNNNNPMDDNGHGTHTAGTIGAVGNNGIGITGVMWKAKIMAVKSLSMWGYGTSDWLAGGLKYAADNGAVISSNSWGGSGDDPTIEAATKYAYNKGQTIVAAAGNSRRDALYFSPAGYTEVITVGATDETGKVASFSNYGPKVDITAPGVNIVSLKSASSNGYTCSVTQTVGTQYCKLSGTSMATPHVAGLAGLLKAAKPGITNEQIRQVLRGYSDDLGTAGRDADYGYGRINAVNSLGINPTQIPTVFLSNPTNNGVRNSATTSITGSASSVYNLDIGCNNTPTSWQNIRQNATSRMNAMLATYDTTKLECPATLRLSTKNSAGKNFEFEVYRLRKETEPPRIYLTNRDVVGKLTGMVAYTANATDNDKLKYGEIHTDYWGYYDGTSGDNGPKATFTTFPYTLKWDTATYPYNNLLNTVLVAVDQSGNIAINRDYYLVTSNNTSPPPQVNMRSNFPATVSGITDIAKYFYTSGDFEQKQEVLIDGRVGARSYSYILNWDTYATPNGTHTIQIKTTDQFGRTALSPTSNITVNNPVKPDKTPPAPPVSLRLNYASCSRTRTFSSFYIGFAKSPSADVVGYLIYADGSLGGFLPSNYVSTETGYAQVSTGLASKHTFTVHAVDGAGNKSTPTTYNYNPPADIVPATGGPTGYAEGFVNLPISNTSNLLANGVLGINYYPSEPNGIDHVPHYYAASDYYYPGSFHPYDRLIGGREYKFAAQFELVNCKNTNRVNFPTYTQPKNTTPPTKPSNLSAAVNPYNQIVLKWEASQDAFERPVKYNLSAKGEVPAGSGKFVTVTQQTNDTVLYGTTKNFANGKWTFTLTAADIEGNVSPPSQATLVVNIPAGSPIYE